MATMKETEPKQQQTIECNVDEMATLGNLKCVDQFSSPFLRLNACGTNTGQAVGGCEKLLPNPSLPVGSKTGYGYKKVATRSCCHMRP